MSSLKDWKSVSVNPRKLQSAYDKAVAEGLDQFTFEGNEYVTQYAKYLLEYINIHKHPLKHLKRK